MVGTLTITKAIFPMETISMASELNSKTTASSSKCKHTQHNFAHCIIEFGVSPILILEKVGTYGEGVERGEGENGRGGRWP